MSGLSDYMKGVKSDPPPEEPKSKEPEKGDDDDRSIENVRGEMLRKLEKTKADIISTMRQELQSLNVRPEPTAPQTGTKSFEDMSSAELLSFKNQVDWEKASESDKAQFELLVTQKQMEEKFDTKLSTFQQRQQFEAEQKQWAQEAAKRYPDLGKQGSELAQKVDSGLRSMSDNTLAANPRAILDLANEAAIELNIRPNAAKAQAVPGRPAGTRTGPVEDSEELPANMASDEQHAALMKRFKNALPKDSKFDLAEIKKEEAEIRRNMQDYEG